MRAIWKGTISFGLVSVPVRLFSATEEHDLPLHQVHDADGGRIRYRRQCEVCGEVIAYEHIDKAYDDGEQTVVLAKDELAALPSEHSREIEVLSFVPSDQIDPILLDRTYFLEADPASRKPYALLLRTLEATDRTAVTRFALRQRTRLTALRARGDVLTVQTLLWPDEIRDSSELEGRKGSRVSTKELEMARSLVDSYAEDFDPAAFTDEYQVELRRLVDAKLEQGDALDTEATFGPQDDDEGADVVSLMDALRRSVAEARSRRAG
ncbi:non-homologous end joining protein Ku [Sanguibacter sp. A247]|uniref:non-homologous end joining protein Ku n=1 Tax=unclassified Sanguibacter TaxID=2645534 RepID=UPI003FD7B80F